MESAKKNNNNNNKIENKIKMCLQFIKLSPVDVMML